MIKSLGNDNKKIVLLLCFVAYTCSYLLRTNLSVALPDMMNQMNMDKVAGGIMGSTYFCTYAIGQLVNGALAEKISPKLFILIGFAGSIIANVLITFTYNYLLIVVFWGLNGYFLSMLWCSMVKILTAWFKGDEYKQASFIISLPTTIGYIISWGAFGIIVSHFNWQLAFVIPAIVTGIFLIVWVLFLKEEPTTKSADIDNLKLEDYAETNISNREFIKLLATSFFILTGMSAMIQGVIKEGINLWLPTIVNESSKVLSPNIVSVLSVIVPITGTVGIFATSWLTKKSNRNGGIMFLLLSLSVIFISGLILFNKNIILSIAFLGLLLAAMSGYNVFITSIIPVKYLNVNRCSQVAGILNFLVYLGAGFGGILSGLISDNFGFIGLYIFWLALSVVSIAGSYYLIRRLT